MTDGLQRDRAAQVTLESELNANRFSALYLARELRSVCRKCKDKSDSFEHMLRCCALRDSLKKVAETVAFLLEMAVKVKLVPPRASSPFARGL